MRLPAVRPLDEKDWVKLGYTVYAAVLANFLGLAVWHLTPYTLAVLGALLGIGYAVTYPEDKEKGGEDPFEALAEYAC